MRVPVVRIIQQEEWRQLEALAADNDFVFDDYAIDWSESFPYWLGAFNQGGFLVGAINIAPGRPIGRMECLFLHTELSNSQRGLASKGLTDLGTALLRDNGSQIVAGMIQDGEESFSKVASKRGWGELCHSTMFARGVA